ncbi:acetylglutamate kinase [Deltaproteobacteria bacterium Smac51]|nr:acetylglutamate kinase [Deltaproteobacteria bacterium Smac51]
MTGKDNHSLVSVLVEALPYIRKFRGGTFVIKFGGHAMVDDKLKRAFAEDVTLLKYVGFNPIVVHGGGPQINDLLQKLNIETKFVEGQRVTDEATMEVVEMVLSGKVGKEIVSLINEVGGQALGISGKDAKIVKARRKQVSKSEGSGEMVDIGLVGEPTRVDTDFLRYLAESDVIPVVAPIGWGPRAETYNINADAVAGAVAGAMQVDKLILMTDVEGVLDQDKNLMSKVRTADIPRLKRNGVITGGMIPKVDCCLKAVEEGAKGAYIIDGRRPHALLHELFTDQGFGTEFVI